MSLRNKILDARLWVAIDFMIGGWDMREAMIYFGNGEPLWGALMLVFGLMLIIVGTVLMVISIKEREV